MVENRDVRVKERNNKRKIKTSEKADKGERRTEDERPEGIPKSTAHKLGSKLLSDQIRVNSIYNVQIPP